MTPHGHSKPDDAVASPTLSERVPPSMGEGFPKCRRRRVERESGSAHGELGLAHDAGRMTPSHPARSPALRVDPSVAAAGVVNPACSDDRRHDPLSKGVDVGNAAS